ncbi:uncharacterized protein LOC135707603 [Ochlerotatus camptorhynchus]|uniref:uncharacterized protein LOC135707603 n=1 Tax=Ochlerotatus camptorhynchus TaxID=644619 RepID=UPI0031DF2E7C
MRRLKGPTNPRPEKRDRDTPGDEEEPKKRKDEEGIKEMGENGGWRKAENQKERKKKQKEDEVVKNEEKARKKEEKKKEDRKNKEKPRPPSFPLAKCSAAGLSPVPEIASNMKDASLDTPKTGRVVAGGREPPPR